MTIIVSPSIRITDPEHTPEAQEKCRVQMETLPRSGEAFRFTLGQEPDGWFQDDVGEYTVVEHFYIFGGKGSLDHVHVVIEPGR